MFLVFFLCFPPFFCSFLLLLILMYFTYACIFSKSVEFLRMPRELSKNSPLARPFLAACEMEQIVEPTACCWRFESDCWGEADRSCRFQRIVFRCLKCFFLTLLIFSFFFCLSAPRDFAVYTVTICLSSEFSNVRDAGFESGTTAQHGLERYQLATTSGQ